MKLLKFRSTINMLMLGCSPDRFVIHKMPMSVGGAKIIGNHL